VQAKHNATRWGASAEEASRMTDLRWTAKSDLLFAGPTFASLVKNGGKMETDVLRRELESQLRTVLADRDFEPYPDRKGSDEPRWWTDVRSAAENWRAPYHWIEKSSESGHGWWSITTLGEEVLAFNRTLFEVVGYVVKQESGWRLTNRGEHWLAR